LDTETAKFKASTWLVEDQASGSSPKPETLEDGRLKIDHPPVTSFSPFFHDHQVGAHPTFESVSSVLSWPIS